MNEAPGASSLTSWKIFACRCAGTRLRASKAKHAIAAGGPISNKVPTSGRPAAVLAARKLTGDPQEHVMTPKEPKASQIRPSDESERAYLESLIRSDYERCHPDETLEDLKHR